MKLRKLPPLPEIKTYIVHACVADAMPRALTLTAEVGMMTSAALGEDPMAETIKGICPTDQCSIGA